MKTVLLALSMMCLFVPCFAAETVAPKEPAKKEAPAAKDAAPAAKPAAPAKPTAPAKPAAPAKPKKTTKTEIEFSGSTSETSDRLGFRLNLSQTAADRSWWLRPSCSITTTRTYSKDKVTENDIDYYNLDGQYKVNGKGRYKFISAVVNLKDRSPYTTTYGDWSGYYMVSAGLGRTVMPGLDAEMAIGNVTRYDHGKDSRVTMVSTLRLKKGLTDSMSLDANANLVQSFDNEMLIDSQANLTYKLTPNISLRFTYRANNLTAPILTKSGWDRQLSTSLVFSRTTY